MTRVEKVARARELRARGLTVVQVAAAMGVARATVYGYFGDPDLTKQRARLQRYRGRCIDCGATTNGSEGRGPNAPKRCAHCGARRLVAANAARNAQYRERVERLWAEGRTAREISAEVGSVINISTFRALGYDLPHRRTPEQLARMTAGSSERLAKARAALQATRAAA